MRATKLSFLESSKYLKVIAEYVTIYRDNGIEEGNSKYEVQVGDNKD